MAQVNTTYMVIYARRQLYFPTDDNYTSLLTGVIEDSSLRRMGWYTPVSETGGDKRFILG